MGKEGKLTALELCERVMRETDGPMTPGDIWEYAQRNGIESTLKGKTPVRTINEQLYTDAKKPNPKFVQTCRHPPMFYLAGAEISEKEVPEIQEIRTYNERELHPLLVAFTFSDPHFHCRCKTIMQETSKKGDANSALWLHPDIVGVYFPFDVDGYNEKTISLFKVMGQSLFKLFSFEIKREVTRPNVRKYYFQAISNSSWANEGYLVSPKIRDDAMEDLRSLNESFGIGVIRLNVADVAQSEILFPSRVRTTVDSYMIDRLTSENADFRKFVTDITDSHTLGKTKADCFDRVMDDEELTEYCKRHEIN